MIYIISNSNRVSVLLPIACNDIYRQESLISTALVSLRTDSLGEESVTLPTFSASPIFSAKSAEKDPRRERKRLDRIELAASLPP